jgi:simple sugar transport system ATP-binding protein
MSATIEMKNIVKRFGQLVANDHINLSLREGEILCILGENGAGKTTLMNILYGLLKPDEGEIYVGGDMVNFRSPRDAIRHRIGMVSQHFSLVPTTRVSENITLGNIPKTRFLPFLDEKEATKRAEELARSCGFNIDVSVKAEDLSVGEQQRVEILKALYQGAGVLILDEPTAVLTSQESEELFRIIRSMTDQGRSILFITHKMKEAMSCDRILALRGGKVVFKNTTKDTNIDELTEAMFGRSTASAVGERTLPSMTNPVLDIKNLSVKDERGLETIKNVSLEVYAGEIFGVAGVAGNGQRELSESITGLHRISGGTIRIKREDITGYTPKLRRERGMIHIPEERKKNGVFIDLPFYLNLILGREDKAPFSKNSLLNYPNISDFAKQMQKDYQIKISSIAMLARHLSGGNLQKLVLAREFACEHIIIIAAQPTRGLDVMTTNFVRRKLLEERGNGKAVLLISYDLDEIFELSDRIGVMFEGEMTIVDVRERGRREIENMMIGAGGDLNGNG